MTLRELFNAIDVQGDIILKVYNPDTDEYKLEKYYDQMEYDDRQKYLDYTVTYIYPNTIPNDIVIEVETYDE